MRMNQDERRFDFHGLGAALKRAREEKGWTQAYVAELVDRDSRTIMNIENKGQYPSFDLFVKLITMFDVSVDQFIHADGGARSSSCRKHIDVLLNSMTEKELVVIEATAEGILKQADGKSSVQNSLWREKLYTITDMLTAIRRRLKIAKKENAYSTYGTGEDVAYCFYDRELAEWLNSTREEILKILSSICKEAGLRELHFRKHRYRW